MKTEGVVHYKKSRENPGYVECAGKTHTEYIRERRRLSKSNLITYKGGACCICGYKKCNGSLDFHHVGKKDFALGGATDCSFDRLKKEADKTVLVCRNCHGEIHAGMHPEYNKRGAPARYGVDAARDKHKTWPNWYND